MDYCMWIDHVSLRVLSMEPHTLVTAFTRKMVTSILEF